MTCEASILERTIWSIYVTVALLFGEKLSLLLIIVGTYHYTLTIFFKFNEENDAWKSSSLSLHHISYEE